MRGLLQTYVRDRFLPSARTLSVAFVYEDDESHGRATALYEFLLKQLDENAQLTATWWRTSLLGDPKLSRVAGRAVGGSDLIVLAIAEKSEPSPLIQSWIESWPLQNDDGRPIRLVALLQGTSEETAEQSEWSAFLSDFAGRKNLLYLPGTLPGIGESAEDVPDQHIPAPEAQSTSPPSRVTEPYLHWGLNE